MACHKRIWAFVRWLFRIKSVRLVKKNTTSALSKILNAVTHTHKHTNTHTNKHTNTHTHTHLCVQSARCFPKSYVDSIFTFQTKSWIYFQIKPLQVKIQQSAVFFLKKKTKETLQGAEKKWFSFLIFETYRTQMYTHWRKAIHMHCVGKEETIGGVLTSSLGT